jgi:pseudaminic acid synthase
MSFERKPFIVAELSANHLGSFERALEIVKCAAAAGADALKVQVWKQDTMCLDPDFTIEAGPWAGRKLVDLYREAYTPWEWLEPLFKAVRNLGMKPVASPFDRESVDFLEALDCPIYKIASFELVDIPLIRKITHLGKPVIMSTGMASLAEIDEAAALAHIAGCEDFTMLKCVSAYPAKSEDMNLWTMMDLKLWQACKYGLSDHSLDNIAAITATAMGASVIEKHLTLARADGGPDAGFSLEPKEFAEMVKACRQAAAAIGRVKYGPTASEATSLGLRRSLYIAQDMQAGDILTMDNLRTARPALGLAPVHMPECLGKSIKYPVPCGTPLTWEMIDG